MNKAPLKPGNAMAFSADAGTKVKVPASRATAPYVKVNAPTAGIKVAIPANVAELALRETVPQAVLEGKGFKTFAALKKHLGPAGDGYAWHHIVEQTRGNLIKFGPEAIQNTGNVRKLPHGKGLLHMQVSGYYSSKPMRSAKTIREWLSSQSYQAQYKFGEEQLMKYGWKQ